MNDNSNSESDRAESKTATDSETDTVTAEQGAIRDSSAESNAATQPAVTIKRGGAVAWFALLIALAAAGFAAREYWLPLTGWEFGPMTADAEDRLPPLIQRIDALDSGAREQAAKLEAELTELRDAVAVPDPRLATLGDAVAQMESEFEELRRSAQQEDPDVARLENELQGLMGRLNALEQARNVDSGAVRERLDGIESRLGQRLEAFAQRLDGFDSGLDEAARTLALRLQLQDIDRLLNAGQDALMVSADIATADRAWQRARLRINRLDGPRFESLKRLAAEEQAELEQWESPSVAADVRRLYELSAGIDDWPHAGVSANDPVPDAVSEQGWRGRLGGIVDSLVQVENRDEEFVNPARTDASRRQLQQELDAAAAALGRGDFETVTVLAQRAAERIATLPGSAQDKATEAANWLRSLTSERWHRTPPRLERTQAELTRLLETLP